MIRGDLHNEIAKLRYFALILQLMTKTDPMNDKILRTLSRDGRISNLQLADEVGLSPSACLRRVQELERSGRAVSRGVRLTAYSRGWLDTDADGDDDGERYLDYVEECVTFDAMRCECDVL